MQVLSTYGRIQFFKILPNFAKNTEIRVMATSFSKEEGQFLRAVRGKVANHKFFSAIRFGTGTAGNVLEYFQGTPEIISNVNIIVQSKET